MYQMYHLSSSRAACPPLGSRRSSADARPDSSTIRSRLGRGRNSRRAGRVRRAVGEGPVREASRVPCMRRSHEKHPSTTIALDTEPPASLAVHDARSCPEGMAWKGRSLVTISLSLRSSAARRVALRRRSLSRASSRLRRRVEVSALARRTGALNPAVNLQVHRSVGTGHAPTPLSCRVRLTEVLAYACPCR
jgi:hypothetical protein